MTPTVMTAQDLAAEGWSARSVAGGFPDLAGGFWSRRDGAGGWRYAALPGEAHVNNRGVIHGGYLLTFADHALGLTVWERAGRRPGATAQLNMHFVDAAVPGELLEMDAEIVRMARSIVFVRGVIRAGERPVAAADGVWKLLGPSPGQGGTSA